MIATATGDGRVTHDRAVPLRPLGLVELLDGAVRLVRRNPAACFTLALPFAFARTAVLALVTLASVRSDDTTTLQTLTLLGAGGLFGTVRTGLLAPVYTADLLGTRVTAGGALRQAAPALLGLTVLAVIVMVAQGAGALALAVGGVWLWGVWAVAAPALVVERLGPLRALRRSFQLVRRVFWLTWGRRALGSLVTYVLSLLVTVPFAAIALLVTGNDPLSVSGAVQRGADDPQLVVLITALGGLIAAAVVGPISSAIDALLYVDLRMRREGMDLVMTLPALPPAPVGPVTAW